jgi:hypothetical protein
MYKDTVRKLWAFSLILSVWVGALAFFPVGTAAQKKQTQQQKQQPLAEKQDVKIDDKRKTPK